MFELAQRARWQDVHDLLASGHPPLFAQMLAVNVVFLMYITLRGLFVKPPLEGVVKLRSKPKSKYSTEALAIAANLFILYESSWLPYFTATQWAIHLRNFLQI